MADIFGIGNTLIDLLIRVNDSDLDDLSLKKGVMKLVPEDQINKILKKFAYDKIVPAGAVPNTMMGLSALKDKTRLLGKVGSGSFGDMYEEILKSLGVESRLIRCKNSKTGKVLSLITPDAERTFAVNLGAAINLEESDLNDKDIDCKYIYFTGYEFESINPVIMHAVRYAKKNNIKIVMDLADPDLVDRTKEDLQAFLRNVDILFMNELEAKSFTGLEPEKAAKELGKKIPIVVAKMGENGSVVVSDKQKFQISAVKVNAIDTTGAGDLFAAGFLHGLLKGQKIEECGRIGSIMGAKIVTQLGPMLDSKAQKEILAQI